MIRQWMIGFVAFFALLSLAWAGDGPNIKEGLWEITVKVHTPGLELHFPPFTNTQCITKADLVPQSSQPGAESCKIKDHKVSGNTVTWTMVCDGKESGYTSGTGNITYAGETLKGELVLKGDNDSTITSNMTGKYIGPCKK
jgi:hypothetical protein